MTDWDAWSDFTRALTGHLRRAPAGSDVMLYAPLGVVVDIRVERDMMVAIVMPAVPLPSGQVDALRGLGWSEQGSDWVWRTLRHEGLMDERAAMAVVHVLTDVVSADTSALVRVKLKLPGDGYQRPLTMIPPVAPVMLDTAGLQRDRQYFVDPSTGAAMSLDILDRALDEPFWLDDLDLARRKLARGYAQIGCLIEAKPITVGGVRGMAQIWKQPAPAQGRGFLFGVAVWLAKTTQTVQIMYLMDEARLESTGMREVLVVVKLQNYGHASGEPHPYDPELHGRLPFYRSDDEVWDEQFPGHPLTCIRAWVRGLDSIVTVDSAFAALPDFRGTTRQPEGR
jgi:hypothetical protein